MSKWVLLFGALLALNCSCERKTSHGGTGGIATSVKSYSLRQFYAESPFWGRVLTYEHKGYPANPYYNSGPIYDIVIERNIGGYIILRDFRSGKHAAGELDRLVDKDSLFPECIYRLRDSILFD
jgi:hypothetical protein